MLLAKVKKNISSFSFTRKKVIFFWIISVTIILIISLILVGCKGAIYYPYGPQWSPDGGKLAFIKDYEIWVMNSDGSNKINLTGTATNHDHAPTWSPEGSKIAFVSELRNKGDIFVMNADGTNKINLTDVK